MDRRDIAKKALRAAQARGKTKQTSSSDPSRKTPHGCCIGQVVSNGQRNQELGRPILPTR